MSIAALAIIATLLLLLTALWRRWRRSVRADYIRAYTFPPALYAKLQKRRPELALKDCQLVGRALRQFFLAYLQGGCRYVSMPSQVVDDLWHELILYTRHYDAFCKKAFGGFLHHTPAVVLSRNRQNNTGLRRIWWLTCREENIDPRKPSRLPLLFAIDKKLNIEDGFIYVPDCRGIRRSDDSDTNIPYCGGDFSSSDFDGSTEGFGDWSDGGNGDGDGGDSGCGGGCGGD
ncbi:hypothetical protein [Methylomicrobium sp. Wu6]|uniref:glycine-rich domain-containing protein n=1 Tax=Methylomicrobium sp. Wu6 TaxID=3107928 RepID=UPI002DD6345A|nr:hypothetical protein [Methylomicrobium sp. Wu6]MEC4748545.1 hypothetical protein [Methylomicrobium sp. Wu6]